MGAVRTTTGGRSPQAHGHRGGVWWANPLSPVLLLVVPALVAAYLVPAHAYLEHWRTPKFVEFGGLARSLVALLLLSVGTLVVTRGRLGLAVRDEWPDLSPVAREVLRRAFFVLYRITCAAYVVWVLVAVQRGLRPASLLDTLREQNTFSGELKRQFETVAGVTTLTQCGIAAVVIGALLTTRPDRAVTRRVWVLFALAVARGFFLAERLAMIELVLPWLVVRSGQLAATGRRRSGRWLVRAGPIVAIPVLLVAFSLFEYSRSWSFARTRTDDTFLEYSAYRLAGYYATSINNGELNRTSIDRTERLPYFTVEFFWTAPVVSSALDYRELSHVPPGPDPVTRLGNPEYNSPGGVAAPFIDFGSIGGFLYYGIVGLVLGALYRSFAGSRLLGLLLYPTVFTGLLELPRYLYWAQGRVAPAYAALVLTGLLVAARARAVQDARRHLALA